MTYPRNIFTGPPDIGKAADLRRRLHRLERVSGLGHQRAYRRTTTAAEITVSSYGLLPFLEIDVHVPEGGWVTISGGCFINLTNGASASTSITAKGAVFETTDPTDLLYAGVQVYEFGRANSPGTSLTQELRIRAQSSYGQYTVTGGTVMSYDPLIYRPATPGNRTYRMDFLRTRTHTDNIATLNSCWFGIEVS